MRTNFLYAAFSSDAMAVVTVIAVFVYLCAAICVITDVVTTTAVIASSTWWRSTFGIKSIRNSVVFVVFIIVVDSDLKGFSGPKPL